MEACPFGAMQFDDDQEVAVKCDLCIERLENNEEPACSKVKMLSKEKPILDKSGLVYVFVCLCMCGSVANFVLIFSVLVPIVGLSFKYHLLYHKGGAYVTGKI